MSRTLSTAEVSRVLQMGESDVRAAVRSGLCRPGRHGRRYAFSFRDLVVLRTAKGLMDQRVPRSRIHRALAALREDLASDDDLSGVRVYADGARVAVRGGGTAWEPETGQTLLDFAVDDLARAADAAAEPVPVESADAAFALALELEDDDPKAACEQYRRAIALDPTLLDAHVNLGRLVCEAGDPTEAASLYRRALALSPDDPVVHYNLALALEDTGDIDAAVRHYEHALAQDPDFADAHFNLAGLYEQSQRGAAAIRHYHAYKKLTGT